jgi:hypothetical protein
MNATLASEVKRTVLVVRSVPTPRFESEIPAAQFPIRLPRLPTTTARSVRTAPAMVAS